MDDATLDAIEARAKAATPGPWAMWDGYGPTSDGLMGVYRFGPADGSHVIEDGDGGHALYARREDWEFVAMSREDVPALVAEVRRLREQVADAGAKALEEYAAAIRANPSTPYQSAEDIARDIPEWVATFVRP